MEHTLTFRIGYVGRNAHLVGKITLVYELGHANMVAANDSKLNWSMAKAAPKHDSIQQSLWSALSMKIPRKTECERLVLWNISTRWRRKVERDMWNGDTFCWGDPGQSKGHIGPHFRCRKDQPRCMKSNRLKEHALKWEDGRCRSEAVRLRITLDWIGVIPYCDPRQGQDALLCREYCHVAGCEERNNA
jgi:hypothetical protein